jgi:3-oxoadipate enol-lactonase
MTEKVPVGDVRLHYTESGQGEAILFINGLGADLSIWSMQVSDLSRDHRVILFDHRGTGRSDRPVDGYDMETLADDADGLLRALGVPSAHLVGHSMGGLIAQLVALRHPERVKSLVLAATSVRAPRMAHVGLHLWPDILEKLGVESFIDLMIAQNYTHGYVENHYRYILMLRQLLIKHMNEVPIDAGTLRRMIRAILDLDTEAQVDGIRVPALVLVGDQDIVFPPVLVEVLARRIPKAEFVVLERCAHNLMLENPEAFNARVRAFLHDHVP